MTYRISRKALADIEEIERFLSKRSPSAAVSVLDAMLQTFDALVTNPAMGELRDDLFPGVRMFVAMKPAHNYVVFYIIPLPMELKLRMSFMDRETGNRSF